MGPALDRTAYDCLVAEVETVEIAKRDHRATQGFRHWLVMEQALH
jgi:hypothetical protein